MVMLIPAGGRLLLRLLALVCGLSWIVIWRVCLRILYCARMTGNVFVLLCIIFTLGFYLGWVRLGVLLTGVLRLV